MYIYICICIGREGEREREREKAGGREGERERAATRLMNRILAIAHRTHAFNGPVRPYAYRAAISVKRAWASTGFKPLPVNNKSGQQHT